MAIERDPELNRVMHEIAVSLYEAGAIDEARMRYYDVACAVPPPIDGSEIRVLREREQISRAEFARTLFVSPQQVARWENGRAKPRGAALKLLTLVQQHGLKALA